MYPIINHLILANSKLVSLREDKVRHEKFLKVSDMVRFMLSNGKNEDTNRKDLYRLLVNLQSFIDHDPLIKLLLSLNKQNMLMQILEGDGNRLVLDHLFRGEVR